MLKNNNNYVKKLEQFPSARKFLSTCTELSLIQPSKHHRLSIPYICISVESNIRIPI
jgi:hypothetical protein